MVKPVPPQNPHKNKMYYITSENVSFKFIPGEKMENVSALFSDIKKVKTIIIDISALALIYFTPAISHLFNFPFYLIEPMRLMLILTLVHTTKRNAFLIAFTLPVFSFIISAHPSIIKSLLIAGELAVNVWLFYELSKLIKHYFVTALLSIIISKIVYYAAKALLISSTLLQGELISTPIYLQLIMTVLFSTYIYFMLKEKTSQ